MKLTTSRKNDLFYLGLLLVAFVVLGLVPTMTQSYAVTLLTDFLRYAVLALAWAIFSGFTGYMSLATAAFYGLGFYIAAVTNDFLPFAVVIIIAGAVAFVIALLVGALTLRLRGVYFCIFTFALTLLVSNVVMEVERIVTKTRGRFVATETTSTAFYAMLIVMALTFVIAVAVRRSRHGLALQSIGEHEEAAAHSGINVVRVKVMIFAVSAITMGMAGAIIATPEDLRRPRDRFQPEYLVLAGPNGTVGRDGQPHRAGHRSSGLRVPTGNTAHLVSDLYMLLFGVVLIMAMLVMPNGIVGLAQESWLISKGERSLTRTFL